MITAGFYGNLISPLCTSFSLMVKPSTIGNDNENKNNNINNHESQRSVNTHGGDSSGRNTLSCTVPDGVGISRSLTPLPPSGTDNTRKGSKRLGKSVALSSNPRCASDPDDIHSPFSDDVIASENPWLLRSLLLADKIEDSKVDAVSVTEAVLFSHAFGLESSFDKGLMSVTISEYVDTQDEGDSGENDPQDNEKDPDDDENYPNKEPDDSLKLQARLELSAPIHYLEKFLDRRNIQYLEKRTYVQKSLLKVHQGRYCGNLNRLQFDFKFIPTLSDDWIDADGQGESDISALGGDALTCGIPMICDSNSHRDSHTTSASDTVCNTASFTDAVVDIPVDGNSGGKEVVEKEVEKKVEKEVEKEVETDVNEMQSDVVAWLHRTIVAVGASGISLLALHILYENQSTESSSSPTVDVMSVAERLRKRGLILIDYGHGFCTGGSGGSGGVGGLRCIEAMEDHPVHFVDASFASLYVIEPTSDLYPEESSCPWVIMGGTRNELFYRMLRSKVASILSHRPGSSLRALHAGFPQLTFDQLNILVCSMAKENVVFSRVPTSSAILANPFQKRSAQKPHIGYYLRL